MTIKITALCDVTPCSLAHKLLTNVSEEQSINAEDGGRRLHQKLVSTRLNAVTSQRPVEMRELSGRCQIIGTIQTYGWRE